MNSSEFRREYTRENQYTQNQKFKIQLLTNSNFFTIHYSLFTF